MTNARNVFLIQALTDLHPGSGDDYTRNVDRVVQRDTRGFPTLRASGVKGALRDHVQESMSEAERLVLFGSRSDSSSGKLRRSAFYTDDMSLVALACNYNSEYPYVLVTSPTLTRRLTRYLPANNGDRKLKAPNESLPNFYLGDTNTQAEYAAPGIFKAAGIPDSDVELLKKLWTHLPEAFAKTDYPFVIVPDSVLKEDLIPNSLQVNARNSLDRGISENLWFEEVIPADSIFVTGLAYASKSTVEVQPDKNTPVTFKISKLIEKLVTTVQTTPKSWTPPVRLGANKTVGQGQTQWAMIASQVSTLSDDPETSSEVFTREDQKVVEQDEEGGLKKGELEEKRISALGELVDEALKYKWITSMGFDTSEEADAFAESGKELSNKPTLPLEDQHKVLCIDAESLTALNRISSLLRRPLCEILNILDVDLRGQHIARKQVAQLINHILKLRKLSETKLDESTSIFSLLGEKSHFIQGTRLALDYAIEQLKTVAAFAATTETKNESLTPTADQYQTS